VVMGGGRDFDASIDKGLKYVRMLIPRVSGCRSIDSFLHDILIKIMACFFWLLLLFKKEDFLQHFFFAFDKLSI
jgi:hypothetical protein